MLAYLILHGAGPVYFLLNLVIYCLVALIFFLIFQWIALEFGFPPKIVKLVGLLIFLVCILSLFVGCSSYQSTVSSRKVSAGYNSDGTIGFSDKVIYR